MKPTARTRRRSTLVGLALALVVVAVTAATATGRPEAGAAGAVDAVGAVACAQLPTSLPAPGALPATTELPDPFKYWDGTRMTSSDEWSCRREQLRELLQYYEYGHLPAVPTTVTGTRNGSTLTVSVTANGRTSTFNATLRLPSGTGPFPAIILLNPLAASAASRGYAEVSIDPNSIASDSTAKTGAFWNLHAGADTGVLMAWAWGVHRTLDALRSVPQIDTTKVGVSGYSRYGKAAVVAGAFDDRIALTVPGSSGTAGMGNYRYFFTNNTNDEKLEDILGAAYWFTPRFATFRGQSTRLPIDQHSLAALVAPRLLLTTSGTEGADIRTNPQGTGLTHRAARKVYEYLGVPDRIGINYRPGGHQIDLIDYNAIMDFADKYLKGLPVNRTFNSVPYPDTPAAHPWTAPTGGPTSTTTTTTTTTSSSTTTTTTSSVPGGACAASYRTVNSWQGGHQGEVTVTAGSAINGWTVRWTLASGQSITQVWGGVTAGSGTQAAVRNASWNGNLAPNASTTFGFIATGAPAATPFTCISP